MKKIKFAVGCLLASFNLATQAAQLVVPSMPEGLKNGSFVVACSYNQGTFSAEGPVTNWGNYGLIGALKNVNALVSDKDTDNFKLRINLFCQNQASISYYFDTSRLKAAGEIVLDPPANCA